MVKIEVDTKRNTKEDIQKVIEFLQQFVDEEVTNVPEGAFNLFNQDTPVKDNPDNDSEETDETEDIDIKPMFY